MTALLGPNGAGKSTMLRMLCGLARPSRGTVRVLGRDPRTDVGVTRSIGLVPQQESVFEPLTAHRFVRLTATLHGLRRSRRRREGGARDWSGSTRPTRAGCPRTRRACGSASKVAQGLVHDPAVVMLDEPLTGLDPRQRADMIALFRRLGAEGRCVLVSSHVLDEVERLGSQILVMSQGRLAAAGDFRELRALMDDRPLRVRVRTDRPRELAGALLEGGTVVGARLDGEQRARARHERRPGARPRAGAVARASAAQACSRSCRSTRTSRVSSATWCSDERGGRIRGGRGRVRGRRPRSTRSIASCSARR